MKPDTSACVAALCPPLALTACGGKGSATLKRERVVRRRWRRRRVKTGPGVTATRRSRSAS